MSRKKRAIERQKKQIARQKKKMQKLEKSSNISWEEKKERKQQSQLNKRESAGISVNCPLLSWEKPTLAKCAGCKLKCSFEHQ